GSINGRAGEADERRLGQRGHQERAEVAAGGTVGFVNQAINVGADGQVFVGVIKLVNHGDDETAEVCLQQLDEPRLAVGVLNLDVLGLQFTEQPVHPADELAFQFV